MALGVSARELGRQLGVSDAAVRKAAKTRRIPQLADGTFDVEACRKAWGKATDPGRSKVREPANLACEPANLGSQPTVRTEEDAKAAIALIARVLLAEGVASDGGIDFNAARTADTILKAHERELKIAQRRKELVPLARVKEHVEKAFIGLRQAIQRMPSRHVPEMAATLGCDPRALDAALSKAIAAELNELSAPVVRA